MYKEGFFANIGAYKCANIFFSNMNMYIYTAIDGGREA